MIGPQRMKFRWTSMVVPEESQGPLWKSGNAGNAAPVITSWVAESQPQVLGSAQETYGLVPGN